MKPFTYVLFIVAVLLYACGPCQKKTHVPYTYYKNINPGVLKTFMGYKLGSYFIYQNSNSTKLDTILCKGYKHINTEILYPDDYCPSNYIAYGETEFYNIFHDCTIQQLILRKDTDRSQYKDSLDFFINYDLTNIYCPATQKTENVFVMPGYKDTSYYKYNFGLIAYKDSLHNYYQLIDYKILN